jgi:hypothetical protein
MIRSRFATLGAAAALGFAVLAFFNAAMLGNASLGYAIGNPGFLRDTWPTFSRALSGGNAALNGWLAGIAGAGLFAGSLALAAMQWQRAWRAQWGRGLLIAMGLMAACASLLGIVHYFHVAITLEINNRLHMLLSYTFFFGMSGLVIGDLFCNLALARLPAPGRPPRLTPVHRAIGIGVLADGVLFLLCFVLKDVAVNPWQLATQRLFVVAEFAWVVLAHSYGLCYIPVLRRHFRAQYEPNTAAAMINVRT